MVEYTVEYDWVRELAREQREDGGWGRFHSRDSQARHRIPTTEMGVERALALGLDVSHPILSKAARYLVGLLEGPLADFPDLPEKDDRWATGARLFTAATLALVQPDHPVLDDVWNLRLSIAQRTFAPGRYDAGAETLAHRELTGATARGSHGAQRQVPTGATQCPPRRAAARPGASTAGLGMAQGERHRLPGREHKQVTPGS